jgi:hypothetical protein
VVDIALLQSNLSRLKTLALLFVLLAAGACGRGSFEKKEYVYVAATQVRMRDRLAQVFNTVATPKNGDKLEVLERQKRFVRVKNADGQEGWVEQRYLIGEDVFQQFQKLSADHSRTASQGQGITRSEVNMHITPERDSPKLYQLHENAKLEVLQRASSEKPANLVHTPSKPTKPGEPPPPKPMEDWWLVRSQTRVGWVLARMVDLDVPLEVAQYAEGDRIMACFVLSEIDDPQLGKKVPQYLMLLSEPKDGQPFDYNQARVFTWNLKRHRYETAYRERGLYGRFPVIVGQESFGTEGTLPTFTLRVLGERGSVLERKYKLNQPIVRRVAAEGQEEAMAKLPGTKSRR